MAEGARKVVVQGLLTAIVVAAITFVVVFVLARFVLDAGEDSSMTVAAGALLVGGALGFLYGGASAMATQADP